MTLLLCLNCGKPVVEVEGELVNPEGEPCEPGQSHWVGPVIPDAAGVAS